MKCPSCQSDLASDAWICEACDFIVDPSVLMPEASSLELEPTHEHTHVVAWSLTESTHEGGIPDAVLLGVDPDAPDASGADAGAPDRRPTDLFYAPGYTARILAPHGVPMRTGSRLPPDANPYERHLWSLVDGHRSVALLQRASNLAAEELTVTLLTLQDRGLIQVSLEKRVATDPQAPTVEPSALVDDEHLVTQASEAPVSPSTHVPVAQTARERPASEPPPSRETEVAQAHGFSAPNLEAPVVPQPLDPEPFEPPQELSAVVEAVDGPASQDLPSLDPGLLQPGPAKARLEGPWPGSPSSAPLDGQGPPPKEPSEDARPARSTGSAPPGRRSALARAVRSGPIQEKRRSNETNGAAGSPSPEAAPAEPDPPAFDGLDPDGPPLDPVRARKARTLYEQALQDEMEHNLVSARMNMKLALTFAPQNREYRATFERLSKLAETHGTDRKGPTRSRAKDLYDKATDAENQGDWDAAIGYLEKALKESEQAAFHNRLGVLIATKQRRFEEAQQHIERAIELQPSNPLYERNLQKILQTMATWDVDDKGRGAKKRGGRIAGFFRRK